MPIAIHSPIPVTLDTLPGALTSGAPVWVDIDGNGPGTELLREVFRFHPLSIEDTQHPNSRVKVEEYDGYLFVTVRVVRFCEDTPEDPYDLETVNLYFFVGPNYLVTVHAGESPAVSTVRDIVQRNPDVLQRGVARIAHMILDEATDAYFPILDQIDTFVEGLEDRVFARFDESALQDIFRVKRMVLSLRRYLAPQREVYNALSNRPTPLIPPAVQPYFRDIYDHMLRINDGLDAARELLSGTMESYLSQVSNRLGRVTTALSVVATMSLPFVVVSGMWGMNFQHIPLSANPHGFAVMLVAQLAAGGALVAALKWRGLL